MPSTNPVPKSWRGFVGLGFLPKIGDLHFLARAVTPQHLPRRFDTRFFIANAASIAYCVDGVAHADAELVELRWLTIAEALELDVGNITGSILREAAQRFTAGLTADLPAAYFYYRNRRFSPATNFENTLRNARIRRRRGHHDGDDRRHRPVAVRDIDRRPTGASRLFRQPPSAFIPPRAASSASSRRPMCPGSRASSASGGF